MRSGGAAPRQRSSPSFWRYSGVIVPVLLLLGWLVQWQLALRARSWASLRSGLEHMEARLLPSESEAAKLLPPAGTFVAPPAAGTLARRVAAVAAERTCPACKKCVALPETLCPSPSAFPGCPKSPPPIQTPTQMTNLYSESGSDARPVRRAFAAIYGADIFAPIGTPEAGSSAPKPIPRPPLAAMTNTVAAAASLTIAVDAAVFDAYGGNDPAPPPPQRAPAPSEAYELAPGVDASASARASAVHAFVVTQDYFTFACEGVQSAVLNGVVPHVVGFGGPGWESGDGRGLLHTGVPFRWGLGKPVLALRAPIEALVADLGGDVLVLVADAHDALLTVPGAALVHKFRAVQARAPATRVLFSAERSCFPISAEDCARFPEPPQGLPYRMLNSGAWMGSAADVLNVLDAVELLYPGGIDRANTNDQAALQYLYLDPFARAFLGLALDYGNEVFMNMHMAAREARPHGGTPGRVCNALSGSCPAVLHFNGGSKGLQVPIDSALATTAAAQARGPAGAALRRALGAYVVPGVDMPFRDFCCDPRWTDHSRFNKVPVASMRCAVKSDAWAEEDSA